MSTLRANYLFVKRQRGAALMVMLVILIIGISTFLVSALSQISLKNERNSRTADVLAQAKDALIGYAAKSPNMPGSLPCPDTNNDGSSEGMPGNCTTGYIGRLPWKTLGLPDLRDSTGERLWYALSSNFHGAGVNSDTQGLITTFASNGTITNDGSGNTGVIAVIIAPNNALQRQDGISQSRSCTAGSCDSLDVCTAIPAISVPKCDPRNYLDIVTIGGITGDNSSITNSSATKGFIQGVVKVDTGGNLTSSENGITVVNDQILAITRDQLLPVVEMRIAREVRSCLNNYALGSGNIYPWAAKANPLTYSGSEGTLFGRIATTPDTSVTTMTTTTTYNTTYVAINSGNDPNYSAINSALNNLQNAVTNCTTSDGGSNPSNLNNAANVLLNNLGSLTNPPYTASFINIAANAANTATANGACNNIENNSNYNSIQTNLTSAQSLLSGLTVAVTTPTTTTTPSTVQVGSITWPTDCFGSGAMSSYWNDWKNLVFYQIDDKYKPGGTLGTPSITINNSGNYRAAVVLARRPTPSQIRNPVDVTTYLEGANPHTDTAPALNFETHQLIDQPATNDLVLCLDGNISTACK